MKRALLTLLTLLTLPLSAFYSEDCCDCCDYTFYIKAGSGISFSESADVQALPPTWDPAIQGYDAKLGNRGILAFSVGCEWMKLVDIDLSISHRSQFKYRKFQTPVAGGASYTREFDLDVTPVLLSVGLLGQDLPYLNWECGCGSFYPIIGGGVGMSSVKITNFRTTGLAPTGASALFNSFSAENQFTQHNQFTYTAFVGVEYRYGNRWAVSTGYRWLDAGRFKGPRFKRVASGAAVDVQGDEWKMRFRANEWFVDFKIFI